MTSLFMVVLVIISLITLASFSVSAVAFVMMSFGQLSESVSYAGPLHQSSPIFITDIPQLPISAGFSVVCTYRRLVSFFSLILFARFFTNCSYHFLEYSVTQLNCQSMQPICILGNQLELSLYCLAD